MRLFCARVKSVSELLWQILIWNTYLKLKLKYFIYHQQQHISEFFLSLFQLCMHLLLCTCLKETRVLSIFFFILFYISFHIYTYFSSVFYVTFIVWRVMRFNSPCILFTLCFMRIITSFTFENNKIAAWTPFRSFLVGLLRNTFYSFRWS